MSYPHYTEFAGTAPHPPYCNGSPTGCVVCATADVIKAMTGKSTPDLTALGSEMGDRCRAHFGTCHGLCSRGCAWGTCCAELTLKARGIGTGYARLTHTQLRAHAAKRHPIIIAGTYGRIPYVSPTSYSVSLPARGRSDSFTGSHGIVLWYYSELHGTYDCSDADFGSPGRPVVPPYSKLSASAVESMYDSLGYYAAYCLSAPAVPTPPVVAVPANNYKALGGNVRIRNTSSTGGTILQEVDAGFRAYADAVVLGASYTTTVAGRSVTSNKWLRIKAESGRIVTTRYSAAVLWAHL